MYGNKIKKKKGFKIKMEWETILANFVQGCVSIAGRLLLSAVVFGLGMLFIKLLLRFFPNGKKFGKMDETVEICKKNLGR